MKWQMKGNYWKVVKEVEIQQNPIWNIYQESSVNSGMEWFGKKIRQKDTGVG